MSEFADPQAEEVPDEVAAMFDLSQKKRKKKKSTKTEGADDAVKSGDATEGSATIEVGSSSSAAITELDPPNYSYSQLLNRVVDFIHQNNPELTDKKRFTMKPPQLMRGKVHCSSDSSTRALTLFLLNIIILVGTKKTLWVNFQEICAMMRRNSDHVFQFMMAELGTEGSIDGNKRLVIRGKFVPKVSSS